MNAFEKIMIAIIITMTGVIAYAAQDEITEIVVTGTYRAELDEFEMVENNTLSRDTNNHVHIVAHDRDFRERIYCIQGVSYIYQEVYMVLWGRNGLPIPCDRVRKDNNPDTYVIQ